MRAVLLTESDYKKLIKEKQRECRIGFKNFSKKKKTHLTDLRLKDFYENNCTDNFSPMLYTIPFKCYFSFYLYLYLKKYSERFPFELDKYQFLFSKPFDVNLSKISKLTNLPLNTVKSGFKELIHHDFLLYSQELSDPAKNKSKTAMLANDYFIVGYDSLANKTSFYNRQMKFTTIT
ncbi:MAG: hypothetical protein WAT71_12305 [Ignavibacteria bacterium]